MRKSSPDKVQVYAVNGPQQVRKTHIQAHTYTPYWKWLFYHLLGYCIGMLSIKQQSYQIFQFQFIQPISILPNYSGYTTDLQLQYSRKCSVAFHRRLFQLVVSVIVNMTQSRFYLTGIQLITEQCKKAETESNKTKGKNLFVASLCW